MMVSLSPGLLRSSVSLRFSVKSFVCFATCCLVNLLLVSGVSASFSQLVITSHVSIRLCQRVTSSACQLLSCVSTVKSLFTFNISSWRQMSSFANVLCLFVTSSGPCLQYSSKCVTIFSLPQHWTLQRLFLSSFLGQALPRGEEGARILLLCELQPRPHGWAWQEDQADQSDTRQSPAGWSLCSWW